MNTCKPGKHDFQKPADDGAERCVHCSITWRDWTRGFGSNVEPGERTKLLRAEREAELR